MKFQVDERASWQIDGRVNWWNDKDKLTKYWVNEIARW